MSRQTVPANFGAWDKVDPLSVAQAAYLWGGFEPTGHEVAPLNPVYQRFQQLKGELYRLGAGDRVFPKGHHRVPRAQWKKIAQSLKERPPFLYPKERTAQPANVPSDRTGFAGRSSIKHLITPELEKRISAGNVASSIKEQAELLADWAKVTYPLLHHPKPKVIENHIRPQWRKLVSGCKAPAAN